MLQMGGLSLMVQGDIFVFAVAEKSHILAST